MDVATRSQIPKDVADTRLQVPNDVADTRLQIPKDVADIFNAPSDDEEFLGFPDELPMESLSAEGSCDSLDSLEPRTQDVRFRSQYFTEELRRIFVEDTDSEDFEGFTQSDMSGSSSIELGASDVSEDSTASVLSEEEEEVSRHRRRSGRNSVGLRVAFQFPTKKLGRQPDGNPSCPSPRLQDKQLAAHRQGRDGKEDMASESEDDGDDDDGGGDESQEASDALRKRNLNIKENKAVLARLLAELDSMPDFFPVRSPASASKKKPPARRALSAGQLPRRTNPTRSARPPERFALENFTASAAKFAEEFHNFRRRKTVSRGRCRGYRQRHRASSFRAVEDITEEDLENVAITVRDKIYDKVLGNTCHQCRQKTIDTKTVCRNQGCGGVRGQFCGPCLRNRYGEDVRSALLDPDWMCPPCRGICNCSYCRRRDGRCATGILIHLAKFYGYNNVKEYLESLQKQLVEDS